MILFNNSNGDPWPLITLLRTPDKVSPFERVSDGITETMRIGSRRCGHSDNVGVQRVSGDVNTVPRGKKDVEGLDQMWIFVE